MIALPVYVEDLGKQGLALIAADSELVFSSVDITREEINEVARAINGRPNLPATLRAAWRKGFTAGRQLIRLTASEVEALRMETDLQRLQYWVTQKDMEHDQ